MRSLTLNICLDNTISIYVKLKTACEDILPNTVKDFTTWFYF